MGKSVLNQCLCMSPYFIISRWIQLMRQGLSSLRKLCLVGIRIPIINLGRWSVRLRFLGRFLYLSVYFYWTDLWCPCFAHSWASYLICNIVGCACAGNAGNVFPRHRLQGKPLISDPGMHHGTCVTQVPWCMSGSLAFCGGENVPGIPGPCAPAIFRIWQVAHYEWFFPDIPYM